MYSDPLDALEKATDTRIYHCPEFGEMSEEEEEAKKKKKEEAMKEEKEVTNES